MFGGPDEVRQVSPQPGLDPEHDAKHLVAYGIGDAAVDHLESLGRGSDLSEQKVVAEQIKKHIPDAESIESDRNRIARNLNTQPPESVDQQG